MLGTTPPLPVILNEWKNFDDHVRQALSRILGSPLSDMAWLQASLPTSQCGLGLRKASMHASSAFLSSQTSSEALCLRILEMESSTASPFAAVALNHLSDILKMEEPLPLEEVHPAP